MKLIYLFSLLSFTLSVHAQNILSKSCPAISQDYYWNGWDWSYNQRKHYTYNSQKLLIEQRRTTTVDTNLDRYVHDYDSYGNEIFQAFDIWNGKWERQYTFHWVYDEQNNLTDYQTYGKNAADSFILNSGQKYAYEYLPNGQCKLKIAFKLDSSGWEPDEKDTFMYDQNNFLICNIYSLWNSTDQKWEQYSRGTYENDANGYPLKMDRSHWLGGTYWSSPSRREVYFDWINYDIITQKGKGYGYIVQDVGTDNEWHDRYKFTYEYPLSISNTESYIKLTQSYENGIWVNVSRSTILTDTSLYEVNNETWTNGLWVSNVHIKQNYYYNASHLLSEAIWQSDYNNSGLKNQIRSVYSGWLTGMPSYEQIKPVVIYPNPSSDVLQLSGIKGHATVFIFDLSGKLLYSDMADENHSVRIDHLKAGLYMLRVLSDQRIWEQKFIKQ